MNRAFSRTILVDTSFILTLLRNHRQILEDVRGVSIGRVRLATSEGVVSELERLARSGEPSSKVLARLALAQLSEQHFEIRETRPAVPDADTGMLVLALGDRDRPEVATVDSQLGETLSRLGINVISPRKKGGLAVKLAASSSLK